MEMINTNYEHQNIGKVQPSPQQNNVEKKIPEKKVQPVKEVKKTDEHKKNLKEIEAEISEKERVEEIVDRVNEALRLFGIENHFEVDAQTKELTVKVVDTKTDTIIREIPPKEVHERIARMKEVLGLLFDIKV